jgi:archaemetzincin
MKYLYVGAAAGESGANPEALAAVGDRMAREFGAPVREIVLPAVDFAWDARRQQYGSIPVMEMLVRECPPDAWKLLAVTERDLFIPVLTFVYGQAQLAGRVAVISLARLRQEFYGLPADREIFVQRAVKEALHESGHMFGLVHCTDGRCAMSLATNIRQIDSKHAEFCAACAARLDRRPRER